MRESSILLGLSTVVVAVLCVYMSIWQGKGSSLLVQVNERLESLVFYVYLVPVSVLDLSGSVLVCLRLRTVGDPDRKRSWLETLLSCTLMQFGGTTLTGLLLGQTPSWILSHNAFPALLLAWWLTFYCPGDVYFSSFTKDSGLAKTVFLPVVTLLSAVSSGHAVTSWGMDKALSNAYHKNAERIAQSALTCILAGTFSACGGGILSDCLSMLQTPSYVWRPPTMLQDSKEGYAAARAITKSFFLATLYYLLRLPTSSTQALLPLPSLSAPLARLVVALLQLQSATVVLAHGDDPQYANLSCLLRSIVLNPGGNSDSDSRQDSNPNSGNEKPTRESRDRSRSRGVKRN